MSAGDREHEDDPDLPLLRAFAAGEGQAGRVLMDRYLPRLHGLAYRLLQDRAEAEDVCQEVFFKLWQIAPRWQPRARLSTWLHQVALNAARDRYRRRREALELDDADSPIDGHAEPDRLTEVQQRQQALQQALADLPPRQREAILLCHYQQCSQTEAAAILAVSEGALESLLSRARQGLKQRLVAMQPAPSDADR